MKVRAAKANTDKKADSKFAKSKTTDKSAKVKKSSKVSDAKNEASNAGYLTKGEVKQRTKRMKIKRLTDGDVNYSKVPGCVTEIDAAMKGDEKLRNAIECTPCYVPPPPTVAPNTKNDEKIDVASLPVYRGDAGVTYDPSISKWSSVDTGNTTLIYGDFPGYDHIADMYGKHERLVTQKDIDLMTQHIAEVSKNCKVPGQVDSTGTVVTPTKNVEPNDILSFPKESDWDDLPKYVVDAFKTWTTKSSMESTILVGKTFTISYSTPTSKSYARINIGQNLRNNGESLLVQSMQNNGGTYNVKASFDRNGLLHHTNARELYNYIVTRVGKSN